MPSSALPRLGFELLIGGVAFGFEFVDELIELVEIDAGPKAERVRNSSRRRTTPRSRLFAETRPQRPVHNVLERQPEFACALPQQPGQIVIDGQRRPHDRIIDASDFDVNASDRVICGGKRPQNTCCIQIERKFMRTKQCLTSANVKRMLAACEVKAAENKWAVRFPIVDDGGFLLGLSRMDVAATISAEVSIGKARALRL